MTNDELNEALYDKMKVEHDSYSMWLLALPAKCILSNAYEYSVRQDILFAMEDLRLSSEQCEALLKCPYPMTVIYQDFLEQETAYMDTIRSCIEHRANQFLQIRREAR